MIKFIGRCPPSGMMPFLMSDKNLRSALYKQSLGWVVGVLDTKMKNLLDVVNQQSNITMKDKERHRTGNALLRKINFYDIYN